jgi:ABC-type polysaccharide/polyol phosphate export permease
LVLLGKSAKSRPLSHRVTMIRSALLDILEGLRRADLWTFLGWHDVRQRYRRSTLGPFWITLASVIMIGFMTLVYGALFRQSVQEFLPLVATGIIIWAFISACLTEGSNVFISSSATIKQIPAPLSVHVFRLIWQQLIYLAHNIVVIVAAVLGAGARVSWATLLVLPALVLLVMNLSWMILLLGSISARYRDVPVIVQTFIAALFLVTPIVWQVSFLPADRRWVAYLNPFTYLIEIVRVPALGWAPSWRLWAACLVMAAAGWLLTLVYYARSRQQLAYWI